MSKVALKD
jgi:hypothetical protein